MNKIKKICKQLWQDESGQGATEYILILVVVAAIVFAFKGQIIKIIEERTGEMGGKLKSTMDGLER